MNKYRLYIGFLTCTILLSLVTAIPAQAGALRAGWRAPLAGDGEWTHSGTADEWEWGKPSAWIAECNPGSTEGCWGTDLNGNYQANCNQSLLSPDIYIPLAATAPISVAWAQAWNINTGDQASASYRCNQAATWTSLWTTGPGSSPAPYWQAAGTYAVTCSAGDTLQFRFNVTSGGGGSNSNGLYVDDVRIYSAAGTHYFENFEPGDAPRYGESIKTVDPSEWVTAGGTLTYTIVIANSGPIAGAPALSDAIPAGTSYVPGSAQVQGGGTLTDTASAIEWSGALASEGSVTVTYQVTATDAAGQIVNTAIISDPLIVAPVVRRTTSPFLLTTMFEDFEHGGSLPELWEQAVGENTSDEDWLFATTAASGATQDHTTGAGYFAMVDDSAPDDTPTSLLTPWLDLSGLTAPELAFYLWIGTPTWGDPSVLHVDVYDGTTWHNDAGVFGESSSDWVRHTLSLAAYRDTPVRLRFRAVEVMFGTTSDISLDDVRIQEPPPDLGPDQSQLACPGSTATYHVELTNGPAYTDTYDVALDIAAWNATAVPASLTLTAGESGLITVTVDVPLDAVPGESDDVTLTVTGRDYGLTGQVALTTLDLGCSGEMESLAPLPDAVSGAAMAAVGGYVYVLGGQDGAGNAISTTWRYDPAAGTWVTLTAMPTPLYGSDAAAVGASIYVLGGLYGANAYTNSTYVYDTRADAWSVITASSTTTPTYAEGYAAVTLDGKLYRVGGREALRSPELWQLDPATSSWTRLASLPQARYKPAAGILERQIVVAGGEQAFATRLNTIVIYNPQADAWTLSAATLPVGWYEGAWAVWNDGLWLLGGRSGGGGGGAVLGSAFVYYPAQGSVYQVPAAVGLDPARYGLKAVAAGSSLYVAGGRDAGGNRLDLYERLSLCPDCLSSARADLGLNVAVEITGAGVIITPTAGVPDLASVTLCNRFPGITWTASELDLTWDIQATGPWSMLDMALCYDASEIAGIDEASLRAFRWNDGSWEPYPAISTTVDLAAHCVRLQGITQLSVWTLAGDGQSPTAVELDGWAVQASWLGWLPLAGGVVLSLCALALSRRRKRQA